MNINCYTRTKTAAVVVAADVDTVYTLAFIPRRAEALSYNTSCCSLRLLLYPVLLIVRVPGTWYTWHHVPGNLNQVGAKSRYEVSVQNMILNKMQMNHLFIRPSIHRKSAPAPVNIRVYRLAHAPGRSRMLCVEPNRGWRRAVLCPPGQILPARGEEGFEEEVATSVEGLPRSVCCSHIYSHNQVRGHRTGSSHSGAEEYPREKTQTNQRWYTHISQLTQPMPATYTY